MSTPGRASQRRFRVAFSFAGETRGFVEQVADTLAQKFGREAILYDRYHESEFARADLGMYLPRLYHDEADLLVVVLCPDYARKDWTGLEWRAIHDLLRLRKYGEVMLCRFRHAELEGLWGTAGWVELDDRPPDEIATLILERLAQNEGRPRDTYTSAPRAGGRRAPIPRAPTFYAEPPYLGSHDFLGRRDQLETLDEWASPDDPHPMLLFHAIGGAGKSLLTWTWTRERATRARADWAGRMWYSFYERGAILADFCRHALAYTTGCAVEELQKVRTPELGRQLLQELQSRPWLLVLDGLERVLVAYHRYDAAQLADADAGTTDAIADRDPCATIRPEDDELLRALTQAAPSKLLLTSRLVPRGLLNRSGQPIPGVRSEALPGLRPADAEALFRACEIRGDSADIQAYLKRHCDCHPLVIGVLAGLIHDYLPDRGNFDAWVADPEGGERLNLAELDLVQKRNHILTTALAALPEKGRQLLATLALLSESVDYETLKALNPHLPPEPEEVEEEVEAPRNPERTDAWATMSEYAKRRERQIYAARLEARARYKATMQARARATVQAQRELGPTVLELERRGLLQYDGNTRRYDLHPVVRGVAAGSLKQLDKERYGQRVVDHFTRKAQNPYEQAETLEDVRNGVFVVRTLLQMGKHSEAAAAYDLDLHMALYINLDADALILGLLRPFFPDGWTGAPIGGVDNVNMATFAASALHSLNQSDIALTALGQQLIVDIGEDNWDRNTTTISNIGTMLTRLNRLAKAKFFFDLKLRLAELTQNHEALFSVYLGLFRHHTTIGDWRNAEIMWSILAPMGRDWQRNLYQPGDAEFDLACFQLERGGITAEHLKEVEDLARAGRNRSTLQAVHRLRAQWHLEHGRWDAAQHSFQEAVRMAREVGRHAPTAETGLALARLHLGTLPDPQHEAERLAAASDRDERYLAMLWRAVGDRERAVHHALAAYRWAWADGEPYVRRAELDRSRALLEELNVPVPELPPYDPARDPKLPWEDELIAAIEALRAEKAAEKAASPQGDA